MKADVAVYIGRFQPFHNGHQHCVRQALEAADDVLILVGSTGGPRTIKNPWTFDERRQMIHGTFFDEVMSSRITVDEILDQPFSDSEWISQVIEKVRFHFPYAKSVVLVGHEKDGSSFYLKMFPQWKFIDTGFQKFLNDQNMVIDATRVRELLFKDNLPYVIGLVSEPTLKILKSHMSQPYWKDLCQEYHFIRDYRQSWSMAPFPPIFVTTDAVCIGNGHVLLIKRGQNPGKGLWALPGGFLDQVEGIEHGAIRELIEETNIKLQPEVLERLITHVKVFDRRGGVGFEDRGRIITHAHLFRLSDTKPLPKVRGADDAAEACWVPISEVRRDNMFSDHYFIFEAMLRLAQNP